MILLSYTTEDEIKEKCSRVKALSKQYKDVSFALGYSYQNDSSDITSALKLADQRMYEDKETFYRDNPELKR